MKTKNFRLGIAALVGLVRYFLALSALLFSSLGMPGGNGFGAGSGKTSQSHSNSTKHGKSNLPPGADLIHVAWVFLQATWPKTTRICA